MSQSEVIEGKIARILNSREVAVNIGSIHGVAKGDLFDVLDMSGREIKDPDTGEVIGSIERSKIRLKATVVQDRLSVLSTYKNWEVNVGGILGFGEVARSLMPLRTITQYQTLKSTKSEFEEIDEGESIVKIGDLVRRVEEKTESDQGSGDDG